MKKSISIFVSTFIFLNLILFNGVFSSAESASYEKQYLVGFYSEIDETLIKEAGGKIKKKYKYMPVVSVEMTDSAALEITKDINVEYVEEDGSIKASGQSTPWGVFSINATTVQENSISGKATKIGIVDTGIDYTHEDLFVVGGETFVEGTLDYNDDNGHGTHVAGIVAGLNNDKGVLGVAPNVELYAIKVLDINRNGNYSDLIAGIEWAVSNNLDIVNMSLGGNTHSKALEKALKNAYKSGVLLVAAAGNNGYDKKGSIDYPAKYESVIAVGAIDKENNIYTRSSVGNKLELVAPGVDVFSTIPGGYDFNSGTSMASPHVAGVAALILEKKPELTNVAVRKIINKTATPLNDSFIFGNGLVDAISAINYLNEK
ncbi:S8 family peptidase [Chengkuizengella sp. SCS-71B]|uniref:S8 family peptidase n=1 Tax=Chengkuizengella sp. SCS-71B TaxID=3115290 RepID=UPI0032C23F35